MPAHDLAYEDQSFDLLHQSMLLSSVPNQVLRDKIADTMWRLLRPGGYIVSYDFWVNPFNPDTVGIRRNELRRLFPRARLLAERTITLAPPICRVLSRLGSWPVLGLEKLRFLNTHYLVVLSRETE